MMPRKHTSNKFYYIQVVIACFALLTPLYTYALGVQDIEILSALNQRLNAKVGITLAKGQKIYEIKAKLAGPKAFKQSGLEMPYILTRLKFEPKVDKDGNAYIHITSKEIIREPYLNFLLEVNWQGGNFIREFTVLLDPVVVNQPSSRQNSLPAEKKSTQDNSTNEKLYGPVQDAETLWDIAHKNRPSQSVSVNQMINSIYLANPDAFIRGDINLLRRGVTLRIPQVNSVAVTTNETEPRPANKPKQEQQRSTSNIVTTKTDSEPKPDTSAKPSVPPQVANNPEITKAETVPKTELASLNQSSTNTTKQKTTENSGKLEVTAISVSQLNEIKQSEGEKVYPVNKIEQLRSSIADSSGDIAALKAINADLLRLQNALKKKIEVVRKELEETNKSISKMSRELEVSKLAISKKASSIKKESPTPKISSNKDKAKPTTTTTPATTVAPKLESEKKGINIATDKIAIEQVEKLESEIAELKTQQETVQIQKYVIILLLLVLIGAAAFVILSTRGQLPKLDSKSLSNFIERISSFIKLPSRPDKQTSEFLELIDTQIIPEHLEQSEMPFETKDHPQRHEGYYTDLLARLANQDGGLSALDPNAEDDNESPTHDTTIPEPNSSSNDHNIDRTLTSVDVYVAYRRFSEAEFVLNKAIKEIPGQHLLKAKLLEIYAMKNDTSALSQHLEQYHHQLSTEEPELWEKSLQKCARLIPDSPIVQKYIDMAQAKTIKGTETEPDNNDALQDHDNVVSELNFDGIELLENEEDTDEIDMDLFFEKQNPDNNN